MSVCPITMKKPNLDYDGPRRDARGGYTFLSSSRVDSHNAQAHGVLLVVVELVVVVI